MDPERSKLPILVMLARGVLVAEGPTEGMGATDCTGGITVPATGAGGATAAETILGGSAGGTPVVNGS